MKIIMGEANREYLSDIVKAAPGKIPVKAAVAYATDSAFNLGAGIDKVKVNLFLAQFMST